MIIVIIIIISIIIFLVVVIQELSAVTYYWIQQGLEETKKLLFDNEISGTYTSLLTKNAWFFPNDFGLIFGTGLTPKELINKGSDVGYINNIWKYGIVGFLLIVSMYIKMFLTAFSASKRASLEQGLVLFLVCAFFTYMIKLDGFGVTQAAIITFSMCFKIIYDFKIKICKKNSTEMSLKNNFK